jgi:hypothetical protein
MKATVLIVVMFVLHGCSMHSSPSIRKDIPGTWGWESIPDGCGAAAQTMRFSEDRNRMFLSSKAPMEVGGSQVNEVEYQILNELTTVMRMRITGESRKTESGKSVVWDLVLKDKDTFCWRRTDWSASGCTANLKRCE